MLEDILRAMFTSLSLNLGYKEFSGVQWYHVLWFIGAIIFAVVVYRVTVKIIGSPDEDDDSEPHGNAEASDTSEYRQNSQSGYNKSQMIDVHFKPLIMENRYEGMNTAVLLRAIIGDLNCKYEEDEQGSIIFMYQGERFIILNTPESMWIRIFDVQWYDCSLDKLEEVSCMQKAINIANKSQPCTAVYAIDKDENKMIVYSKCDLLISSEFPEPDGYLSAWLSNFFNLKREVVLEFEKEMQIIGLSV